MTWLEAAGYSLLYAYVFLGLGFFIRKLNELKETQQSYIY